MENSVPSPIQTSEINGAQDPFIQNASQFQIVGNPVSNYASKAIAKQQITSTAQMLTPDVKAAGNVPTFSPNQILSNNAYGQQIKEPIESNSTKNMYNPPNTTQHIGQHSPLNLQNGPSSNLVCKEGTMSSQYSNISVNGVQQSNFELKKSAMSPQFPPQMYSPVTNNTLADQSFNSGFSNMVGSPAQHSPVQHANMKPVPVMNSVPFSGLPLPYNSQNTIQPSPQNTPGQSQPPSARSSRNPSPISTQRYDYMEGQFSNKPSPSNSTTNLRNSASGNSHPSPHYYASGYVPAANSINSNYPSNSHLTPNPPPPQFSPYSSYSPGTPQAPVSSITTPARQQYPPPQQFNYNPPTPSPNFAGVSHNSQSSPIYNNSPQMQQQFYPGQARIPDGPVGGVTGYDPQLHAKMAGMSVQSGFSKLWGHESINLLQDRSVLPAVPLEPPKIVVQKPNCDPKILRCTLNQIPESSQLLQKSRLPFGVLIHPFREVSNLPVIQCNTIVRCRSCRTYINPFSTFLDLRRWKCNLCCRINDLPDEFHYNPTTGHYGDPYQRPEMKNATVEFIAPSDYMLRPPQPASYLFVLDVSHSACEIGYLANFCKILLENLESLPGDSRTRIGFITFDGSVHFYNLAEGQKQPHMIIVSDISDMFLPSPDNLLVNLSESKPLVRELLEYLPKKFANNWDTNNCLGVALEAAYKLMSPIGGRITVIQTCLTNIGHGSLKNREDPNQRAAKDVTNVGPANDFYKKLSLECSGQQIAVDLFLLCSQYVDIATISCISKYSSGSVQYYPGYHYKLSQVQVDKFAADLRRYLRRRIGFEAVMRIRCTHGLSIHTFHGNFFVRSTDLLSLPNVNPDVGFAMQIAIEEKLDNSSSCCFQAAVLYTSSKGERRIRVHTLNIPVTTVVEDVWNNADQEAIIGLVSKMAVDRSVTSSLSDARDALINVCIDLLGAYKLTVQSGQSGSLMMPYSTRLVPLFILALLKHVAFRTGVSTKLDDRVYAMELMKVLPLSNLMKYIYPPLYPVHALDDKNAIHLDDETIVPQPPILQLSSEKIDRHGIYLLDTHDILYLYIGRAVNDLVCQHLFGVPNFSAIPENMTLLPQLNNPDSQRLKSFIWWLQDQKPSQTILMIIREDSSARQLFMQYMVDDRTESLFSYYEFLQHLRQQISK